LNEIHGCTGALQSYVEAMGRQLAIIAELQNRPPMGIKRFSKLSGETKDFGETDQPARPWEDAA
jgi:hypothetical protein